MNTSSASLVTKGAPWKGYAAAIATVVLWASAFPTIKIALTAFEPVPLAALRFAIAAFLWLMWLALTRPALPKGRDGARLLICALIGIAAYNMLLNTGQQTVSSGAASFIVNTVPAITALLAVLFLKERFAMWGWIGTLVSFVGVAIIAMGQPGGVAFGSGTLFIIGAACCQAVFFIVQRSLVGVYGAKLCAACVMILGALCLSPWLATACAQAMAASQAALIATIYLGIAPAAIGYATWGIAQAHFGASRAANFLYLVPPITLCLAFLLTFEIPSVLTLLGGLLAIVGVIVVNTRGR